jgi:hypothetical protein
MKAMQFRAVLIGFVCSTAAATTVPFTEAFTNDAANWRDAPNAATADWFATGGADGGGYISESFSFANSAAGDTPVILRAQSSFNSSGNNFFGNWLSDGVTEYRMAVRNNASVPVNFFARFVQPAGFPGAVAVEFAPVLPGVWTEIDIPIDPANPQFISFETSDFNTIFSNIGRIQVGVQVPAALAGNPDSFSFDLDQVRIVPEPTSVMLILGLSALGLRRR